MTAQYIDPAAEWETQADEWRQALESSGRTSATSTIYPYAVRSLGEWVVAQGTAFGPSTIIPAVIRAYLIDRRERCGLANAEQHHRCLCAFFRRLVELRVVATSPVSNSEPVASASGWAA